MVYFILPIFLLLACEILGSIVVHKYHLKSFQFNGMIGFVLLLAIFYCLTFPLIVIEVPFKVLFIASLLVFVGLAVYSIINRKFIKIDFSAKELVVVLVLVGLQIYFASLNSVGDLFRYDTVSYTNIIGDIIYSDNISTVDFYNGVINSHSQTYNFQGYYKLAAVLYYLMNGLCNRIGIQFFYFTQHCWMYSLVAYTLFGQLIVNFIKDFDIKKWTSKIFILLFIFFFMGNFYWNSEQAYLGNTFRILMCSYTVIYIGEYLRNSEIKDLIMIGIFNYAQSSCASSNTTLVLIVAFFIFIFMENKTNHLRILLLGIYLPLINCIIQPLGYGWTPKVITFITAVLLLLGMTEKLIYFLSDKLKLKKVLPVVVLLILVGGSLSITHNLFDLSHFLDNWSGWADMSWDYTDFSNAWSAIANVIYIILMALMIYRYKDRPEVRLIVLLALVFFNPFSAAIQNTYMPTYYRNYDIFINYWSLFMGIKVLDDIEDKRLGAVSVALLIAGSAVCGFEEFRYHPDDGFPIGEDYNWILKMDDSTADAIAFTKDYVISNGIRDEFIISSIVQMRSELPYLKTLYNRTKYFDELPEHEELYKIFYPKDYYGDPYAPKDPDYEHMCPIITDSNIKLIIQDKKPYYYDEKSDTYYSLTYEIDKCGIEKLYENDGYAIYLVH